MNAPHSDQLGMLTEAYVLGELELEQLEELEALLLASKDARLFFLAYLEVHAGLAWEFSGSDLPLPALDPHEESLLAIREAGFQPSRWAGLNLRWALPLAAVVVGLLAVAGLWRPARHAAVVVPALATVKASLHGQWADGREVRPGAELPPGMWELQSGLVELATASGTVLLVEAPARLELLDALHGRLLGGNLVVRMPKGKSGFVVEMPQMQVTDLGTEFGVSVGFNGESRVQVFDGKVRAEARRVKDGRDLLAGQTLRCTTTGTLASEKFSENRFIRYFPPRNAEDVKLGNMLGGPLFSKSVQDSVQIAPPTAPVSIDGDLSEWNRAGAFRSSCLPPYQDTYYVDGMMMYDARNLYISAHVGDPQPMCNAARDEVDFAGGSVIVRLSTDRKLGWPLKGTAWRALSTLPATRTLSDMLNDNITRTDAELSALAAEMPMPDALSDRVASIILSYDAQTRRPRLRLLFGFDSHGYELNPAGWQGAFRRDANGRGYTLEYAIPWRLLHCSQDPPRPGDVMSALWMVHWSDADGCICRGQLVDVTNHQPHSMSTVPPYLFFQNGQCWGKAIYLPQETP